MPRILLVEDDPVAAKIVARLLEGAGHSVEHAANGQIATQAFERSEFDLMVTDWMMPGMDGEALCHWVRARTETAHLPVILMTGHTDWRQESWVHENGVDVLEKPIRLRELTKLIAQRLSGPR